MLNLLNHKKFNLIFFIGLFILTLFLYHNNLTATLVSDDYDWIASSINRHPLTFFTTNFAGKIGGGNYNPVVNFIYYFSYQIGGLNPLVYHLFSLAFHFGNIILIYLLARLFFDKNVGARQWHAPTSILSALFFAIYFNHSEAVAWVAAIPHVSATFFYLLSILFWFKFFQTNKKIFFVFSLISFCASLLSKEIAMSLPLVLITLQIFYDYLADQQNPPTPLVRGARGGYLPTRLNYDYLLTRINYIRRKFALAPLTRGVGGFLPVISKKIFLYSIPYFLILIFYLFLRHYTTGILFGYYSRSGFEIDIVKYISNAILFLISFIFTNSWLVKIKFLVTNNLWFFVFLFLSFFVGLGFILKKYTSTLLSTSLKTYFLSLLLLGLLIVVYLPLSMNPLNNEGERYLYLPSVLLCVFLARFVGAGLVPAQKVAGARPWAGTRPAPTILLIIIILSSSFILYQKNQTWLLGSKVAQTIIQDFEQISKQAENKKIVFLYLPDNLDGTQVFRNAIKEAINLHYPNYKLNALTTQTYIILNKENYQQALIDWRHQNRGALGQAVDQQKIVTGIARQETDEVVVELWGYDYEKSITDKIYFGLKSDLQKEVEDGKVVFLYFDEGRLRVLNNNMFLK